MGVKTGEWIGFGFSEFSGDRFSLNIKYRGEEVCWESFHPFSYLYIFGLYALNGIKDIVT